MPLVPLQLSAVQQAEQLQLAVAMDSVCTSQVPTLGWVDVGP
jgi:hypothetical protein